MATPGEGAAPSAARLHLLPYEAADLAEIAAALPPGWVATIELGGQTAMTPRRYVHFVPTLPVADAELGVVYRMRGRDGVRVPPPTRTPRSTPRPSEPHTWSRRVPETYREFVGQDRDGGDPPAGV